MKYYIEIDGRDIGRFRIDKPCQGSHGNCVLVLKDKYNMTVGFELLTVGFELLPQRPHGEWDFIGNNLFKCTHCGYIADADYLRKWKVHTYDPDFPTACLKCGAKMKEGEASDKTSDNR